MIPMLHFFISGLHLHHVLYISFQPWTGFGTLQSCVLVPADWRFALVMLLLFNMVGIKSATNAQHKWTVVIGRVPLWLAACVTQAGVIKDTVIRDIKEKRELKSKCILNHKSLAHAFLTQLETTRERLLRDGLWSSSRDWEESPGRLLSYWDFKGW